MVLFIFRGTGQISQGPAAASSLVLLRSEGRGPAQNPAQVCAPHSSKPPGPRKAIPLCTGAASRPGGTPLLQKGPSPVPRASLTPCFVRARTGAWGQARQGTNRCPPSVPPPTPWPSNLRPSSQCGCVTLSMGDRHLPQTDLGTSDPFPSDFQFEIGGRPPPHSARPPPAPSPGTPQHPARLSSGEGQSLSFRPLQPKVLQTRRTPPSVQSAATFWLHHPHSQQPSPPFRVMGQGGKGPWVLPFDSSN